METFGFPPDFPADQGKEVEEKSNETKLPADKAKGKKVCGFNYYCHYNYCL